MNSITNPTPAGRSGSVFLLVQAGDLAAGNLNGPAQVHDLRTGQLSEIKPLQVWFKWGVYEPTDQAEYEQAQAVAKAWDESRVNRHPAGTSEGGQFAPKDGAGSSSAGSTGQAMTGPEVRKILEDLENYRADEIAALKEERTRRHGAFLEEYVRQLDAGVADQEPAKRAIETMKHRIAAIDDEIYEIEKDRVEKQRQWLVADKPGRIELKFPNPEMWPEERRQTIENAARQFNELVGKNASGTVVIYPSRNGRGSYWPGGEYDNPTLSPGAGLRSVIHELGHHFEHTAPGALDEAINFYFDRTAGQQAVRLDSILPDHGYSRHEKAIPDDFMDPYMGKVYYRDNGQIRSTEIISMGIEQMWADPVEFAKKDPGHFDLIWRLMRS